MNEKYWSYKGLTSEPTENGRRQRIGQSLGAGRKTRDVRTGINRAKDEGDGREKNRFERKGEDKERMRAGKKINKHTDM